MGTPGVRAMLPRLAPPSRESVLRMARPMGEQATLPRHPDLVDLFVAEGQDPTAAAALRAEVGVAVSPFALLSPHGWRRGARVRPDELRRVAMPTIVVWGDREPLG